MYTTTKKSILVAWGYETQQRLMWTKVLFLVVVYIFSFVSFLLFSVRQKRIYQEHEAKDVSMKKFALELSGLPELSGRDVEKNLKDAVQKAMGNTDAVVGVSVAWKYDDDVLGEEEIKDAVKKDQQKCQDAITARSEVVDPTVDMPALRKWMYNQEKKLLGPEEGKEELDDEEIRKKLAQKLTLSRVEVDPPVVNWENFADSSPASMTTRFWKGFFQTYVPALLIWFFVFY